MVSRGNVFLNNNELEGAVASLGSVSNGKTSGAYPGLHKAAGAADCSVPEVDGRPVRILAKEFTGQGAVEVTNASYPGVFTSPEATATVALANMENLRISERGSFSRFSNDQQGRMDLKALSYSNSAMASVKTKESAVSDYFPEIAWQVTRTSVCLTALYDSPNALAHSVIVPPNVSALPASMFASNKPNIVNYKDIAERNFNTPDGGSCIPSAEAPPGSEGFTGHN